MKINSKWILPILVLLILAFLFFEAPNLNPLYFEGAMLWAMLFSIIFVVWALLTYTTLLRNGMAWQPGQAMPRIRLPRWVKITLVVPWLFIAVWGVASSPLISWQAYRDQLGAVETKTFSSDIQAVDLNNIPIVDKALAYNLADKKLGQKPSLGSQVTLGEPTIQMVRGELSWVVPLYHSGFFMWLTNMGGTPGYITVSATNVNKVEYVEGFPIKYQPGGYFMDNIIRNTRLTSALFKGIVDYSFEINDEGRPYWVITTYKNLRGFALPEADGVILVDAATGEKQRYAIDNLPAWVDRVQPEEFVMQQINNQGSYVRGIFNFANKDKFQSSEGSIIVYNNGRCYLFTGLTSVGGDESAIGFMMVDMVTKQAFRYEISGATEYSAQRSAEGKVQHLRYQASFPIIINVGNSPTYFMTLKDNAGLIKQYAFVSLASYSTVGTGETIQAAMADYERAMRNDGMNLSDQTQQTDAPPKKASGTVVRIAGEFDGNKLVYKAILLEYPNILFLIAADLSDELAITQPDDRVTIEYRGETGVTLATAFDNLEFAQ